MSDDGFALEPAPDTPVEKVYDERRFTPEPPPVRLMAIADMTLVSKTTDEAALAALYCDVFGMLRETDGGRLRVRAENYAITFVRGDVPTERESVRTVGVEVPSLLLLEEKLLNAGVEFLKQQSVNAGEESILILDPGGNWVEARESRRVG